MNETELNFLLRSISQRRRCMAEDAAALREAQNEVRRFERAIALDVEQISIAKEQIAAHWAANSVSA